MLTRNKNRVFSFHAAAGQRSSWCLAVAVSFCPLVDPSRCLSSRTRPRASPLHTCTCGGIKWPRAVFAVSFLCILSNTRYSWSFNLCVERLSWTSSYDCSTAHSIKRLTNFSRQEFLAWAVNSAAFLGVLHDSVSNVGVVFDYSISFCHVLRFYFLCYNILVTPTL